MLCDGTSDFRDDDKFAAVLSERYQLAVGVRFSKRPKVHAQTPKSRTEHGKYQNIIIIIIISYFIIISQQPRWSQVVHPDNDLYFVRRK